MKKLIYLIICSVLSLGHSEAQDQNDVLQGWPDGIPPVWHSLPQKMYFYSWSESQGWMLEIYTEMVYGDDGLIDTMMNFNGIGVDTINRIVHEYNDLRKPVVMTITAKSGEEWQPVGRYTYIYDAQGNTSEQLFSIYVAQVWQPATGTRWGYTYDGEGHVTRLITEKFSSFQGWVPEKRSDYNFTGQLSPFQITHYAWINDIWQQDFRQDSLEWRTYDPGTGTGVYLRYVEERWEGGWVPWYRFSYDYEGTYSYERIRQSHFQAGWQDDQRFTWLADTAGRLIESRMDSWIDGNWSQTEGELHGYIVDGIDLLVDTAALWTLESGYVNYQKLVYEDFVHYLGIQEEALRVSVSVFPNPAQECFNIRIETAIRELRLMDLNGREWLRLNEKLAPGIHRLCPDLPDGFYFMRILTVDNRAGSTKVILMGE